METIISIYPEYLTIYQKYLKGSNVKKELDQLYSQLFTNTIIPNYTEIMLGIAKIDNTIEQKYGKNTMFEIIDYLEFIYGNILYETFLYELKKLSPKSVNLSHLIVFKYIIMIEIYKFEIYKKIVVQLDLESIYLPSMVKRSYNCELKISFALKIIKEYTNELYNSNDLMWNSILNDSKELLSNRDIELRSSTVENATSFIKLCLIK